MNGGRSLRSAALLVVAGLIASGCAGATSSPQLAVPHIFDLTRDPAANIAEVKAGRSDVLAANRLRLTLERLFGWHVVTLGEVMRRAQRRDPDLQAWMDALARNTDDVTAAIGLVYGPAGARAFTQQWANHTQFLLDYSQALGHHDHIGMALALRNLADYEHDNGLLVETATGGHASAAAVEGMLRTHVDQMIGALDAAAHDDASASLQRTITAHDYGYGIGDALAQAIAEQQPAAFPGPLDDANTRFCSLTSLHLGSWVVIQSAIAVSPDATTTRLAVKLRASTLGAVGVGTAGLGVGGAGTATLGGLGAGTATPWLALAVNPDISTPMPDLAGLAAIAARTGDPALATKASRELVTALARLADASHHLDVSQVDTLYRGTHDLAVALFPPAPAASAPSGG